MNAAVLPTSFSLLVVNPMRTMNVVGFSENARKIRPVLALPARSLVSPGHSSMRAMGVIVANVGRPCLVKMRIAPPLIVQKQGVGTMAIAMMVNTVILTTTDAGLKVNEVNASPFQLIAQTSRATPVAATGHMGLIPAHFSAKQGLTKSLMAAATYPI